MKNRDDEFEFCPRCDANLTLQKGYSNSLPNWICRGCGEMLINPALDTDIIWVCDGCGETLNVQEGFSEDCGTFECRKCGYINTISEEEIYLTEDEFQNSLKDPLKGMAEEDVLELMSYEELHPIDGRDNVILIRDSENGREYVKKILEIYDADVIRFLKDHPIAHMPKILRVYEGLNHVVLIEEYIEGRTVEALLDDGPVDCDTAVKIILGICDILIDLHSLNPPVIHRDIKPSNIIVTPDGETYLLDVNAAKWYDSDEKEDTRLIGTRYYAAPEQYGFGLKASSEKTDIYALGIVLNRLLTGKMPKECKAQKPFWAVIEKCISLEPSDRYSAKELKDGLQQAYQRTGC